MATIGIYVRVSTVKQDTASQLPDLQAWAKLQEDKGDTVRWYTDKASGKTMNRSDFARLENDLRTGKVQKLVVWRLDRLGRTSGGVVTLLEWLQREGLEFYSLRDGFDLSSAASRMTLGILASVAKFETEVRAERIAAGIAAKRARGEAWGNGRPKGSCHKATPEVREQVIRMKAEGAKVAAIARVVKVSRETVYQILKAPAVA